jgi:hypothetical protein
MAAAGANPYAAPRRVVAGTTPSPGHANKPKRNGLPWDRRESEDSPFFATVKTVLFSPLDAFYRMKRQGGLGGPLLFCIAGSLLGGLATSLYNAILRGVMLALVFARIPEEQAAGVLTAAVVGTAVEFGAIVVFVPLGAVVGSFLNAALCHVGLLMVGGARHSFETTFRVVTYAMGATSVCQVIPLLGGLIGALLNLVYLIMGLYAAHETTGGRAVAAVLLPLVFLAVLCGLLIFFVVSVIIGAAAASASVLAGGWVLF